MEGLQSSFSDIAQKANENTVKIPLPGENILNLTYIHIGLIVLLLFVLVLVLGRFRYRLANWQMKGFIPGVAMGVIVALVVQFALLLTGRTVLTEMLAWKNPPEPLAQAITKGRERIVTVLGDSDIDSVNASSVTADELETLYKKLDEADVNAFKELVCTEQ